MYVTFNFYQKRLLLGLSSPSLPIKAVDSIQESPKLPIGIPYIIGQDLGVIEREALGLSPRKLPKERLSKFEDLWSIRPRVYTEGSIRRVKLTTWDYFLFFPYVHCQIDLDMRTNEVRVLGFADQVWTTIWGTKSV